MIHYFPEVLVSVDGQSIPCDAVSVSRDSPVDFHLPPKVGNLAGADAKVTVAKDRRVTHRPDVPWSPTFPTAPGADAWVEFDGTRVFTGLVDEAGLALADGVVNANLVDPLDKFDVPFSAPPTYQRLAPRPGNTEQVPVDANMLFYIAAAAEALNLYPSIRIASRTDLYVPMTGTAHALFGRTERVVSLDANGEEEATFPDWVQMSGGRIGARNLRGDWISRPRTSSNPTVGSWHVSLEVDPASRTGSTYARVRTMFDNSGFGMHIFRNILRVVTWTDDGTLSQTTYQRGGETLTDIPISDDVERILLSYNVISQTLELRLYRAETGADDAAYYLTRTGPAPTFTTTQRQMRIRLSGESVLGTLGVMSRAAEIGVMDNTMFEETRRLKFDLSQARITRWRLIGHPPVERAPAVAFINKMVAHLRCFLFPDGEGAIWLSDPLDWPSLPVSHVVSDGIVSGDVDLDDVQVSLYRKERFSRVKVIGESVTSDIAWGPGMKPNRIYAGAGDEITLTRDSPEVVLWLKPRDEMFWAEPPDLDFRWAGEPVSEPWHLPDDFARGRGSWWGGFVRNAANDNMYRWAVPGDVIYTVEQLGTQTVKITMNPGPGLGAGEEFINFPNPDSESLRQFNPSKLTQPLPVLRGPSAATFGEVEGVSSNLPYDADGWGERREYVHDAGLSVQSNARAATLAQVLANAHVRDFGEIEVSCQFDPTINLNERVRVEPRSRADVTFDGVVTGIPSLSVSRNGTPEMKFKMWCHRLTMHSITYDERAALVRAQNADDGAGLTYADDRERVGPRTYDQERALAELQQGPNLSPPSNSTSGWNATLGADNVSMTSDGAVPTLRVTETEGGTPLYLHPVERYMVAAGDTLRLSAQVKVTQPADIRWWVAGQEGAVIPNGNGPYPPTQTPADGYVTVSLTAPVTAGGIVRVNLQARGGMLNTGEGFFVRNIIIRRLR